jgi:hypothetical protein
VPGNDLPNLLSAVSIALTLAVIWFAWQTVSEAMRTTTEERNAVAELKTLGQAQADTVAELRSLVQASAESLGQARNAAREADRRALGAAERDQAAAERAVARDQEAFLERQYERVLAVGQLVEEMFWAIEQYREKGGVAAADVPKEIWMPQRNGLRHRLVGLKAALPSCEQIIDAGTAYQAFEGCVHSRNEVEVELHRIESALDELRAAFRVRMTHGVNSSPQPQDPTER